MVSFEVIMSMSLWVVLCLLLLFAGGDIFNLDNLLYQQACNFSKPFLSNTCPSYYDLPFWEVSVTIGTLLTAYLALQSIRESNRRLVIEQTPFVVLYDRILTAGTNNHLHLLQVKNIGRGAAIGITATADPEGKYSIIEGTHPHSLDLGAGGVNNSWAVDEQRVIQGLSGSQSINITSVMGGIPDEHTLTEGEKERAGFKLYLHYYDQLNLEYRTETIIRHSSVFLKIMENKVTELGFKSKDRGRHA